MWFTLRRFPVVVTFKLSDADAERLTRLLDRFGRNYLESGNSARFRLLLKEVDSKLLSPFDSQELHDAYELNEKHSHTELIQYNQWKKERAQRIAKRNREATFIRTHVHDPDPDLEDEEDPDQTPENNEVYDCWRDIAEDFGS